MLGEDARSDFDARVEPVVDELSQRAQRRAYVAVLSGGEMEVAQVKVPPRSPPVGLALGKVLLSGMWAPSTWRVT